MDIRKPTCSGRPESSSLRSAGDTRGDKVEGRKVGARAARRRIGRTVTAQRLHAADCSIANLGAVANALENSEVAAVVLAEQRFEELFLLGDGHNGLEVLVEERLGNASGWVVDISGGDLGKRVVTSVVEAVEGLAEGLDVREGEAAFNFADGV
ncbi:hypothetical protein HG530_012633 [Fusarium avenaceum]|nr:hypothetical protein HG530_012633 [Fusarium avenaceum]